jgi:serine/tyrosine/threonine adenylyltransferase
MNLTLPLRIMAVKTSISSLPLPLPTHLLTRYLTPDPQIKSPADFLQVLKTKPSIQRRSRSLSPESHFSYVAPLPIHFPYRIEPPDPPPPDDQRAEFIEKWLAELEAQEEQPLPPSPIPGCLKKLTSKNRVQERVLIGLSETGLRDCLPHLDVGDSLSVIGPPSLSLLGNDEKDVHLAAEGVAARNDLIDVLSGHALLVGFDENSEANFAPWSLRYSGHQFGVWAGQLGDGRAISVCTQSSLIPCRKQR